MYEDLANGVLSQEDYQLMKEHYIEKEQELQKRLQQSELKFSQLVSQAKQYLDRILSIEKYIDETEITVPLIKEFIDRIYVSDDKTIEIVFKGKLRCGNCKTSLMKGCRGSGDIFYCNHSRSKGKASKCCKDSYPMQSLETIARGAIRNMIYKVKFLKDQVEEQIEREKDEVMDVSEIKKLQTKVAQLQAEKIREYENYADGNYTREMYIAKKEKLTAQIDALSAQITEQENITKLQNNVMAEIVGIARAGDDYFENGLSKEVVDAFIKTIYVYDPEKVEIVFKCEDEIKNALELLKTSA